MISPLLLTVSEIRAEGSVHSQGQTHSFQGDDVTTRNVGMYKKDFKCYGENRAALSACKITLEAQGQWNNGGEEREAIVIVGFRYKSCLDLFKDHENRHCSSQPLDKQVSV